MKKLIMSIFVFFAVGLIAMPSMAKAKKRSTRIKPNYARLQYEPIWFSRLSNKQQRAYLVTMEGLVRKMLRGGVAQLDDPFIQMFLPFADAAPRINNGFAFDGDNDGTDFDRFLAEINVIGTPIDPGCTGNNQVCSPLMGMRCSGGNPGQLACSPDSTATCASNGSVECLHESLRSCGLDQRGQGVVSATPYCQALDRVYRRGSQGIRELCDSGRFSTACNSAIARLNQAQVPDDAPETPTEQPPTGADCEQMVAELERARDNRVAPPSAPENENRNNDFWRNMRGFAQQACGTTIEAADRMMGMCPIHNMEGETGALEDYAPRTIRPGQEGHGTCVEARIEVFQRQHDQAVEAVRDNGDLSRQGRNNQIAELGRQLQAQIAEARASECHTSRSGQITDARGNPVTEEYPVRDLSSIASRIRSGGNLSETQENQLRAATGLSSAQFRQVFCTNRSHDEFMTELRGALGRGDLEVLGTSPESNLYLGHGRVARVKMQRCANNARPMQVDEYEGCYRMTIHDERSIRCATSEHPILAVNRATNRCMLVTGYRRSVGATTEERQIDGTTETTASEYRTELAVRTPGRNTTLPIADENAFIGQYELQEYRCDGERSVATDATGTECWRATGVRERHDAEGTEIEL